MKKSFILPVLFVLLSFSSIAYGKRKIASSSRQHVFNFSEKIGSSTRVHTLFCPSNYFGINFINKKLNFILSINSENSATIEIDSSGLITIRSKERHKFGDRSIPSKDFSDVMYIPSNSGCLYHTRDEITK